MKANLIREHGKLVERFEIDDEPDYVYIQYFKGKFENSALILKNTPNAVHDYLEKYYKDYHVSEELQKEASKFFKQKGQLKADSNMQEFINFLTITLSLNLMVGAALVISIYGGYRLGELLDGRFPLDHHAFTIIGGLFGLIVGALVGYVMIYHYFGKHSKKMRGMAPSLKQEKNPGEEWPVIETSIDDVREAVRLFSRDLPKEMDRAFIVKNDYSIDFQMIAAYLGGIPSKPFYMSKETYEIFEEKRIPPIIDKVQKAVNLFYKTNKILPVRPYDQLHRVNYDQLLQEHYLEEKPELELYFADYKNLITNRKPEKTRQEGLINQGCYFYKT